MGKGLLLVITGVFMLIAKGGIVLPLSLALGIACQ